LNFVFKLFKKDNNHLLRGFYVNKTGYYLRKHKNSIVGYFHNLKPEYLLSDIIVRNQILKYFSQVKHKDVSLSQRFEVRKSLNYYLHSATLIDFIKILDKLYSPHNSIRTIKIRLLFYKVIFTISKRNYRFNQIINLLFLEEFYLNHKTC
jgi:hypothetical protein